MEHLKKHDKFLWLLFTYGVPYLNYEIISCYFNSLSVSICCFISRTSFDAIRYPCCLILRNIVIVLINKGTFRLNRNIPRNIWPSLSLGTSNFYVQLS